MTIKLHYNKFLKQIKPIPEIIQNIIVNIKTTKDLYYILNKTNNKDIQKYKKHHITPIEIISIPTHNTVFVIIETTETVFYRPNLKKYEILEIRFCFNHFGITSSIYKEFIVGEKTVYKTTLISNNIGYLKEQLNKIIKGL